MALLVSKKGGVDHFNGLFAPCTDTLNSSIRSYMMLNLMPTKSVHTYIRMYLSMPLQTPKGFKTSTVVNCCSSERILICFVLQPKAFLKPFLPRPSLPVVFLACALIISAQLDLGGGVGPYLCQVFSGLGSHAGCPRYFSFTLQCWLSFG